MLYKDKYGVYWQEEEVKALTPSEVEELGLVQSPFSERDLFD
jgi:hypothetical protein